MKIIIETNDNDVADVKVENELTNGPIDDCCKGEDKKIKEKIPESFLSIYELVCKDISYLGLLLLGITRGIPADQKYWRNYIISFCNNCAFREDFCFECPINIPDEAISSMAEVVTWLKSEACFDELGADILQTAMEEDNEALGIGEFV